MRILQRATLIAVAIWTLILGSPLAQEESAIDETRLSLKHEFVRMINRDRRQFGLPPVELDPRTSNLADQYCESQIRNGTTGHFTTDGLAPYMRYSFAGGDDGSTENAAAWSANYRFSDRSIFDMMRRSEAAMMAERPPHDGHRQAILDPQATHVGVGLAWRGGELRITQEFLRHYVNWTRPLPRNGVSGMHALCEGRPPAGYQVEAITVHYEPAPQSLSAATANLIDTYSLPTRRREYLPRLGIRRWRMPDGAIREIREEYSDGRRGDFQIGPDGTFTFAVPFVDGPGVYTVVAWVRKDGDSEAFSASNVSIRVNERAGGTGTGTLSGGSR